jgi:hypothetical protein
MFYWIVSVALLVAVLRVWIIESVGELYFVPLYAVGALGGGQLLFLHEQKRLSAYLKVYHPQMWHYIFDDVVMNRPRHIRQFVFSRQHTDDPVLEQHRKRCKLAYLAPFIHFIFCIVIVNIYLFFFF